MRYAEAKRLKNSLVVVETDDGTAYLGVARVSRTAITVHTGFVGRPVVVPLADVTDVTYAAIHPDVTFEETA